MAQRELSVGEAEELREILWSYLMDLRMEIADTDKKDFRDRLKAREAFLKDLLARLGDERLRSDQEQPICASAGPYSSSLPMWRMSLPLTM